MLRRSIRLATAIGLQLVALVLAHDLVYLARFGSRYGEALVHAGHGEMWSATVGSTIVIAGALLVAGLARLAHLGVRVRAARARSAVHPAPTAGDLHLRQLRRLWLRIAPRTAFLSVVLLTIQENVERAAVAGSAPGPGILLSPEYPAALWIAIAVGLLVGLVAALFEWRRRALLDRLRAARAALPRHAPEESPRVPALPSRPAGSTLGRRFGLRAPPAATAP